MKGTCSDCKTYDDKFILSAIKNYDGESIVDDSWLKGEYNPSSGLILQVFGKAILLIFASLIFC